MLAHITPEEAEMLLQAGGSGTVNPETGLPEFQPIGNYDFDPDIYGFGYGQEGEFGVAPGMGTAPPDISRYQQMPSLQDFISRPGLTPEFRSASNIPQVQPDYTPFYQRPTPPGGMPEAPFSAADLESRFRGAPKPVGPALATQPPPGVSDRIAQTLQESPNLRQLLATGAASLPALLNAARMRREGRRSAEELRQLGAPIRAEAENLRRQALGGGLTPQQARQMEAQRARMLQSGAQRGVTSGTQQAMIENQLSRQRAELGQTNLENALRQLGVANAYDEQAIRAKLASDRDTAAALEDVLGNLIRSYAGMQQQPTRPRGETPLPTNQMATVNPRDQLRSQSQGR
jgi:hypothetical protein